MLSFLTSNYEKMNNWALAATIGLGITSVRMKLYELGYKRIEMEYWTRPMINHLVKYYKTIGDMELSEIFEKKWPKNKTWTIKHIEKKRKYLGLKRTKKQLQAIQQRNVDNGRFLLCPVKRWLVTGVAKEGEIRMWRSSSGRITPMIKINGRFIHWPRWAWKQNFGRIKKDMIITFRDNDQFNISVDNLEMITRAEMSRRNSKISSQDLSDPYVAYTLAYRNPELKKELLKHPKLLNVKRQQLLLNRIIHERTDHSKKA